MRSTARALSRSIRSSCLPHDARGAVFAAMLVACALAFATPALAQTAPPAAAAAEKAFEPQVGQEGKDVVWVPTSQALVDKMLDLAKLTPRDFLIDLGSGDGRTVITAAKRGSRAHGIEYNADMVALSRRNAAREQIGDRATFTRGDLFESDLSKAQVITMFLLSTINMKLRPTLLQLRPGTRIVSNTFTMGDWEADQTAKATAEEGCTTYCTAYLWIVPARVEGEWQTPQGTLTLRQTFQKLEGTLTSGGNTQRLANASLDGERISFAAGGAQYTGRVAGNRIEGTVRTPSGSNRWSASRPAS